MDGRMGGLDAGLNQTASGLARLSPAGPRQAKLTQVRADGDGRKGGGGAEDGG